MEELAGVRTFALRRAHSGVQKTCLSHLCSTGKPVRDLCGLCGVAEGSPWRVHGGLWKRIRGRRQSVARSSGGGTAPVTGSGGECAGEVCLDLVKLFGGSSCTDSARMKEFTARVSTAAFAAAASGVPSELRATCMGKSGV